MEKFGPLSGRKSIAIPLQRGDSFTLLYQYKDNDVPMPLPTGFELIIGIYDLDGGVLQVGKTSDGTVVQTATPSIYGMDVTHETSMKMPERARMELTIVSTDGSQVDHASDIVYLEFDERYNNNLIESA